MSALEQTKHKQSEVLMKAFSNACHALSVTQSEQQQLLGVSRATLNRKSESGFDDKPKVQELQLSFIRIYRSLFAIAGGDKEYMRHWYSSNNKALHGTPRELCLKIEGMFRINAYLDAMRGKL